RRQNDGDGKARGRNFGAGMIIFFESCSEAYQERKNANTKYDQPDRSLVIGRNFHRQRQSNIAASPKFKCALYMDGVNFGMRGIQPLIFALLTVGSVLPIKAQIDRIT